MDADPPAQGSNLHAETHALRLVGRDDVFALVHERQPGFVDRAAFGKFGEIGCCRDGGPRTRCRGGSCRGCG